MKGGCYLPKGDVCITFLTSLTFSLMLVGWSSVCSVVLLNCPIVMDSVFWIWFFSSDCSLNLLCFS